MAATMRIAYASGAGPTLEAAAPSFKYNRSENKDADAPAVPKPNDAGTNYSFRKVIVLEVTGADSTSISERRVRRNGAPSAGITLFYRSDASYSRANSQDVADNESTNDATPDGFTPQSGSDVVYDASSVAADAGANGNFLSMLMGLSDNYLGGANNDMVLPGVTMTYNES